MSQHQKKIKSTMQNFSRDPARVQNRKSEKVEKLFNRGFSSLKTRVMNAIDNFAIEIFTDKTKCLLCSQFLVKSARNSCCQPCFVGWMNENDHDDEIIKCRKCTRPIKTVLNAKELDLFCRLVELDVKKIGSSSHFGFPVLDSAAMDLLYEGLKSDIDTSDEDNNSIISISD